MPFDKFTERPGNKDHGERSDNHCRDHDCQLVNHPYSCNDRIKRKDNIQHHDLGNHTPERPPNFRGGVPLLPFEFVMDLTCGFPNQENTASHQDQVTPGDFQIEDIKQRLGESYDPREGEQKQNTCNDRECDTCRAGALLLLNRQLPSQNGDKNYIIHSQHKLESNERQERNPGFGLCKPIHNYFSSQFLIRQSITESVKHKLKPPSSAVYFM